ncbi:right-handed parallel beta-helix repeat-containing protein [Methylorubrum suomiense]|uniref:Right handed beta helix domain-containing protein n=1 Tax=Methylorubrum suomiense TaxID=144191 RepID=A0ABQ4UUE4_9HYPH|nr:right-handed parallel beta-helix repeat-containing protein [Methylorubrum suomiense]GJE75881.1 hypothetical protein BGCPKDLD_2468 [Methylorubrum suomiense]
MVVMRSALSALLGVLLATAAAAQSLPRPQVVTQAPRNNSSFAASTAYVDRSAALLELAVSGKAPLMNPAFMGLATFGARPTFAGETPWDSGNLNPSLYARLTSPRFSGTVGAEALQILGPGSTGDVSGMSVTAPGTARSGLVARALADMAADTVNPLAYGAICDGTGRPLSSRFASLAEAQAAYSPGLVTSLAQDVDTVAWQAALNTGRVVAFPAGRTCTLRARLVLAATGGITGDGSGKFIAKATDFPATAIGTGAEQMLVSVGGTGIVLRGFGMSFTPAQNSFSRPIIVNRATGVLISDLELSGFNAGNLIEVNSSTDVRIQNNLIRDGLLDRTVSNSQLTGVAIDDNLVSGTPSRRVRVTGNVIRKLLVTASFRASYQYQTDGITVLPSAIDVVVANNTISEVGEGIDHQASGGTIAANTISTTYQFGMKLIHGASNNSVTGNTAICPGLGGIVVYGGANRANGNVIVGNIVSGVNCLGEYDANTTYAYAVSDLGSPFPASNNSFIGNSATSGAKASTAYLWNGTGAGNSASFGYISSDYLRQVLAPGATPMAANLLGMNGNVGVADISGAAPLMSPKLVGTLTVSELPNKVQVLGNDAGSEPTIACLGDDANVGCTHQTKGTGVHRFRNGGGDQFRVSGNGATTANFGVARGAATGAAPSLAPDGTDANIALDLGGKGTSGILSGIFTRTVDPTTGDIPAGRCADWSNTTAGTLKRVCNIAGTLRSVALN